MSGRAERHTGKAYHNVTLREMTDFLTPQGFEQVEDDKLPRCREVVFGKRVDQEIGGISRQLTLRVFTGIQRGTTQSRGVGRDAIRVSLFMRDDEGVTTFLGGDVRVHRIATWAKNLQKRLDKWLELLPEHACPKCSMPLVVRETKSKPKRQFLGCAGWKRNGEGCDYTRNISQES